MSALAKPAVTRLRALTAAGCALVALGYVLTGSGLLAVTADQPPGLIPPLLVAAGLFGALAITTVAVPRRLTALAGAALQVLVIAGYVAMAPQRVPSYEVWGMTLKVMQVALLGAFVWLAAHPVSRFGPRQRLTHA